MIETCAQKLSRNYSFSSDALYENRLGCEENVHAQLHTSQDYCIRSKVGQHLSDTKKHFHAENGMAFHTWSYAWILHFCICTDKSQLVVTSHSSEWPTHKGGSPHNDLHTKSACIHISRTNMALHCVCVSLKGTCSLSVCVCFVNTFVPQTQMCTQYNSDLNSSPSSWTFDPE